MVKFIRLLIAAATAVCLCSCANSFKDIKVTSFDLVSVSPKGLSALDASVAIGVDNPTVQVTLTKMYAIVKMDGEPCLHFTADDVTLAPRSQEIYEIDVHGNIDGAFNPFQILTLFKGSSLDPLTVDVWFRGVLKNGFGKDFEYKDIPVKDLIDKI
ncbi:MAG: hypothetical protein J5737_05755 [Bacteroidales bacterium]|nr:hypothetical protein [Bacteroidales bacterium]